MYDSRIDTYAHIQQVQRLLQKCIDNLGKRSLVHDASKLESPEKEVFDVMTPKLKESTYGSEEYKGFLKEMEVGLKHHYEMNTHHPEHFDGGIKEMSLLDVIEMLCDWKAATMRHANGSLARSIEINQERFGYSDEMKSIFRNTAIELELF